MLNCLSRIGEKVCRKVQKVVVQQKRQVHAVVVVGGSHDRACIMVRKGTQSENTSAVCTVSGGMCENQHKT